MATHDTLTGLPNRTLFNDRLDRALALAERGDGRLAVLFIDLDRMKQVNIDHGHPAGDRVVAAAAQRLGQALRRIDTVARWGNDLFAVLVPELDKPEHAGEIAQKLLDTLRLPVTLDGTGIVVTASMGIAVYPLDGLDGETLCKNADIAMFRAKEFGGDTAHFFSADLHPPTATRIQTLLELRRALAQDRFELHYLPAVALQGGRACAAEALVRWARDARGLHLPETFLDTAEESGIVLELGAMVLDRACAQLAAWRAAGLAAPAVTVNLSHRQLRDPELPDTVEQALRHHGLAAADLQLDLPPELLGGVSPALEGALTRLAGLGVALAIDDVGHAPTDFALLQRLPLDLIKLDTGLVANLADDATLALAEALTTAAHRLGARVLAEGVENETLLARVRELGCDQAQGHAVAAPMPADACAAWLAART